MATMILVPILPVIIHLKMTTSNHLSLTASLGLLWLSSLPLL